MHEKIKAELWKEIQEIKVGIQNNQGRFLLKGKVKRLHSSNDKKSIVCRKPLFVFQRINRVGVGSFPHFQTNGD